MLLYTTLQQVIINNQAITVPTYEYTKGDDVYLPAPPPLVVMRKKGKFKYCYLELYCGFDIETTNYIKGDIKEAYMYIWQFALVTRKEGAIYTGRSWEGFTDLIEKIISFYGINEAKRAIIWDANFSFEFQFIRKLFNWSTGEYDFFAKEERKPLLATYKGIEYRECLSISGGSLAQLAKDYTTTQKLTGDLDYSIIRNSMTKLTKQEMQYCFNDVIILVEFSFFIFEKYIKPDKRVPLTKTGLLRSEVKAELKNICNDIEAYKGYIQTCFPDEKSYKMYFRYLFRGGFVHSNFTLTNKVLSDCKCYDITSSYPARMNLSYYPVTPFKDDIFSISALKEKCCIMIIDFYNIITTTMHSIESLHKVIDGTNIKTDNGRVYKADYMRVMLTELDYANYCKFYKWERAQVITFQTAKRGKLPVFIRNVLNRHYLKKATLKAQGLNDTPEYAIVKSGVNSAFGLMVTRISLDKISYNNDTWVTDEVAINFKEEIEKQVLLPQWGIYVAAAARHELLTMVYNITKECGNVVIYCDTDSIKCLPHPKLQGIIDDYNKDIAIQLKEANLTDAAFSDLGMFDDEYKKDVVTRFKTLGAKRYLTEINGKKIKATIAGLPKNTISKQGKDPFELFDVNGMKIKAELSDKITTHYNDEYTSRIIDDGTNAVLMEEQTSVALYEIPFTMLTDKDYYNLLFNDALLRSKL